MRRRTRVSVAVVVVMVAVLVTGAWSAEKKFPIRPITIWTTFAPGGISDLTARLWARLLEKQLGVPIMVDHKPGGGGIVGYTFIANARPDGYTLGNVADYVTPILQGTATYKLDDIAVVAQMVLNGCVLAVAADAPWKTFQEFMDYARKNPGVKWGHQGVGTMIYFRTENLNKYAKLGLIGVPLKGDGEIVPALLGKHIPMGSLSAGTAKAQAEGGKLRILFSFDSAKEFGLDPSIPDLNTAFGRTIPDIEVAVYLVAPSKTPQENLQMIERAMETISKDPEFINETKKLNQMVSFASGKVVMEEKIPRKMALIKSIMQETGQIK
jgi:tripartite-type tricarboxylate transporter receptor subunit TctC